MILIVVDLQNGFIKKNTIHIVPKIKELIESKRFKTVLFTKFVNSKSSPYTKILKWKEMYGGEDVEIASELKPFVKKDNLFEKDGMGCSQLKLVPYLKKNKISEVTLVGLETDACLLKIVLDLFEQNCKVTIISDLCASTKGKVAHNHAIKTLKRNLGAGNIITLRTFLERLK